ncbi:hypothetical protein ACP3TC_04800 [Winslowiella sp. 2C04]|uniref:hypothetical protein n=1 Tax=Winslowiella sp. 2C04 TaxID=3416179 RepID=UPI003CE9607F
MQTQLLEGKPIGTAGRLPAAVPHMSSRTVFLVADAMAITWLKTALKTVSAACTATVCTLAVVTL